MRTWAMYINYNHLAKDRGIKLLSYSDLDYHGKYFEPFEVDNIPDLFGLNGTEPQIPDEDETKVGMN